jgi:predicted amidohydrolase YtcJ
MESPVPRFWFNGRIFTGDRFVEAMLLEDGRVSGLGEGKRIGHGRPTGSESTDLQGRLVVPGLVDSHLHVVDSVLQTEGVDLRGSPDLPEMLHRILAWTAAHPTGPVFGGGWDQEILEGHAWPDRWLLDRVLPHRPAFLDRICRHVAVLNSSALELLGIDRSSPDPTGGRFGRDPLGEPNGLLFENALESVAPLRRTAYSRRQESVRRTLARWASLGLTTVGAMSVEPTELELLADLARKEPLPLSIHAYLRLADWSGSGARFRSALPPDLSLDGVKAHVDGALGPRTAWLEEPYQDRPGERGVSLWNSEELERALLEAVVGGAVPALHAIGDRALLVALELLRKIGPLPRSRIEHASMTPPSLVRLLRESRASVVIQPCFRWSDGWVEERVGVDRARWTYAYRTLRDSGVPLAGSSDAPVESTDPWTGMLASSTSVPGRPERELLAPFEALALYTTGGAHALGVPALGRLEIGGPADFVVLSAPSLELCLAQGSSPVDSTWRGGRQTGSGLASPERSG